ncbi:hypothetical protein LINPERHAP2_LOCUS19782 [Linum perenne]
MVLPIHSHLMAPPTLIFYAILIWRRQFLVDFGLDEAKEVINQRHEVLGKLDQIFKAWVKQ